MSKRLISTFERRDVYRRTTGEAHLYLLTIRRTPRPSLSTVPLISLPTISPFLLPPFPPFPSLFPLPQPTAQPAWLPHPSSPSNPNHDPLPPHTLPNPIPLASQKLSTPSTHPHPPMLPSPAPVAIQIARQDPLSDTRYQGKGGEFRQLF